MADLISKSALLKKVQTMEFNDWKLDAVSVVHILNAPTVDAVEGVVKCKDCEHFYCCNAVDRQFYCRHSSGLRLVKAVEEDSYCSYGKRKDSGT